MAGETHGCRDSQFCAFLDLDGRRYLRVVGLVHADRRGVFDGVDSFRQNEFSGKVGLFHRERLFDIAGHFKIPRARKLDRRNRAGGIGIRDRAFGYVQISVPSYVIRQDKPAGTFLADGFRRIHCDAGPDAGKRIGVLDIECHHVSGRIDGSHSVLLADNKRSRIGFDRNRIHIKLFPFSKVNHCFCGRLLVKRDNARFFLGKRNIPGIARPDNADDAVRLVWYHSSPCRDLHIIARHRHKRTVGREFRFFPVQRKPIRSNTAHVGNLQFRVSPETDINRTRRIGDRHICRNAIGDFHNARSSDSKFGKCIRCADRQRADFERAHTVGCVRAGKYPFSRTRLADCRSVFACDIAGKRGRELRVVDQL